MVSATRAARILGVSTRTLRRYTASGVLADRRSPGGKRIFSVVELEALRSEKGQLPDVEGVVIYGRVSSQRQRVEGDLDRQMARLREAAGGRPVVGEFFDVASGLSDQRRGLHRALTLCQRPEVSVLLVEHEERLARFGAGVIRDVMLPAFGVALEVAGVDENLDASQESELAKDMLAVVTSFSGRLYGQRSAKARALTRCVKSAIVQPDL
ncbi:IS607 family transposase [Streptomyces gobiensis]|uniref:IS607 family transposase n=1 Tax=Streptomyces gobiensis TaxID=2875706 RepID=UPI00241140AF|nr:IS607 family transposase [Streptomyces gobiensis]UGY95306.1 IS607 family transposase [Streptomyces gobiensis]